MYRRAARQTTAAHLEGIGAARLDAVQARLADAVAQLADVHQRVLEDGVEQKQVLLQHALHPHGLALPHGLAPQPEALPRLVLLEHLQESTSTITRFVLSGWCVFELMQQRSNGVEGRGFR